MFLVIQGRSLESWPKSTFHPRNPLKFKNVKIEIYNFSHDFGDFFTNISRSMRPRGQIVVVENVPREISYEVGHSRVSLDLPFNLEIHEFENVRFAIFNFFTFSATLLQISRDLWSLGEKLQGSKIFLLKFHTRYVTRESLGPHKSRDNRKTVAENVKNIEISIFTYIFEIMDF